MTIPITANAVGDIIALVQLGLGAVQRLNNARSARAEYREIQSRLESLHSLLELCAASVNSISDRDHKSTVTAHIDHARTQLNTALQLLPSYKCLATGIVASPVSTIRSIRSRVRDASKSLSWELRQSVNARACLGKLSECTQTIHLAITAAHGADANRHFRSMSSTIASATAVTIAMQTDMSITRSLVESMGARLSSVHDAVSSRAARGSELQATLRQTVVDEMTGLREDLSLQTRQTQQYHRGAAVAVDGLAQQLADIQRAVDALNHAQQRPGMPSGASALDRYVSLSRVSLSTTTLIQISQAVVPSNELVSGGCIGSFLVLAVSAPRMTDQAAYLFCACLLFIAARMHRIYQSPVVVHVVVIVDLFGDQIQLPLHEAKSAEEVHVALRRHFEPGRLGFNLTQSRMYDLSISDDDGALGNLLPDSWTDLLQPGQKLIMNARIQDKVDDVKLSCPACRTPLPRPEEPAGQGRWIKCSRCPALFESSSRVSSTEALPIGYGARRPVRPRGGLRQKTLPEIPTSRPSSRTTIEQELALCKRIRVLSLIIAMSRRVTFHLPEGYELEESPLLSTSRLPIFFPETATSQPSTSHPVPSTPWLGLNPLLRPYALSYCLAFKPDTAAVEGGVIYTANQRDQPATNPPVSRMVIIPDWGTSPSRSVGFTATFIEVNFPVSLANVLCTVHEWLYLPLMQDEWDRLSSMEQRIAGKAFWERVRLAGLPFEQERVRVRGLRRIDYLGDRTYFGGLRPLAQQPDHWILDFVTATVAR